VLDTRRLGTASFALLLVLLISDCTGTPPRPSSAGSPATSPPASPTPPLEVPNPFTIVARFDVGLKHPVGLAIGADGNLYVTDASQRVTVVSPGGVVIRRFGRRGNGPGAFSFVSGDPSDPTDIHASIAVAGGDVYVSDSGNLRVEVFSPAGRFIRQFGASHDLAAGLLAPFDVVVDQDSNVYVSDDQRHDLSKYSPTGRLEWQIGSVMSPDPDLRGDFHLATIDRHGRIVAAIDPCPCTGPPKPGRVVYIDTDGAKVDVFGSNGEFPAGYGSCNVTVDAAGNTFVDSCIGESRNLDVFDRSHRLIGAWYGSPFLLSPRFGPNGEVFTLGLDGEILKLKVALPDA
jgi:DNA-binding beta-propeller fold protein YncE